MKKLTFAEFDELVTLFLNSLNGQKVNAWCATPREALSTLLSDVRASLFSTELAFEERRAEFLKLKAEFEPGK